MTYMKKINKAILLGTIDKNCIQHAIVNHESGCSFEKSRQCDCDAEVLLQAEGATFAVLDCGCLEKKVLM